MGESEPNSDKPRNQPIQERNLWAADHYHSESVENVRKLDLARSFLCCSDDSVRFGMFARATQIENLKAMYTGTLDTLASSRKLLKEKEKGIDEAGREIHRIKEKLSVFASLEKYVHQRRQFENEYVWALVGDEEKKLRSLNEAKGDAEKVKNEYLEKERNLDHSINKIKAEMKELEEKIESLRAAMAEKSKERMEVLKEVQSAEKEVEKGQTQFKYLVAKVEKLLSDQKGVQEHLVLSDMEDIQGRAEREAARLKMKNLEDEWGDLRLNFEATQAQAKEANEKKYNQRKRLETLKSELGDVDKNIKRTEMLLSEARAKTQNDLLRYGPHTPNLVSAIEEASEKRYFITKPVGPCGLYVRLTGDPKWAKTVESVIGGLMSSYCCDNQRDFLVLSRIMEKVCGVKQPPIIISKFSRERHDVQKGKVHAPGVPSLLDILSFDDDIVFNTFVDQARIETILLFETDQQAASFMSHVKNVPKNVRMGLTVQCDQYYPAPNYRTYYGNVRKPLKYFDKGLPSEESNLKLENELRAACAAFKAKSREIYAARQEYMDASETLKKFEDSLREMRHKERKIQVELNQLKDIEDSRPKTITRVALEEELVNLEKTLKETKKKVSDCNTMLEGLLEKKTNLTTQLESLMAEEKKMEKEVSESQLKLEDRRYKIKNTDVKKMALQKNIAKMDRKLNEINQQIESAKECLENAIKAAEDVCRERVNTERTAVQVQKLLAKCERFLKSAERMAGSRHETLKEYKTKVGLYNTMKSNEELLFNAIELMTKVTLYKEKRLLVLQSHTASLVSFNFQATLQTRGYDGELKIDFENKNIEIEVKTKEGVHSRKDPKTLSGGERSYSTVAFILSIWKVVHMPIYFLDEFDVFMDKVNRKVILELLLEHSKTHNQQFVFITPQELENLHTSEIVSLFRLPDPERRSVHTQ